ncbi:kdo(2)-lipid IV(A) palmitoleoyltransferase, partial [Escherichia coli]|nr:kdo(2)-lipid IV(A) palmitoleoyltransferase [Escherichia coli]
MSVPLSTWNLLRYNNSYLQKVTMFPQCKFSREFL